MTTPRGIPAIDRFVGEAGSGSVAPAAAGAPRTFKMKAYTGATIDRWYGRMTIDLAGMDIGAQKKPILLEHDTEKRIGFSSKVEKSANALTIEGAMLDNEHANGVARDCAQGFPFQASMGFSIDAVEQLKDGVEKLVNGRTVRGPGYVATKTKLLESSFCTLGADGNTSAEAFSRAQATIEPKEILQMADETKSTVDVAAAIKADRERLAAIQAVMPNHAPLAMERWLAGDTVGEAKAHLAGVLGAENEKLKAKIAAHEKATATSGVPFGESAIGAASKAPATEQHLSSEERAKADFATKPEVRAEFGDEKSYEAFLRAEKRGAVKIFANRAANN